MVKDVKTIKSIKIQHYMKFDTYTEFAFSKGFNVIIGENNAGKTTLLELIDSFLKNDVKFLKDLMTSYNEGKLTYAPTINITTHDGSEYWLDTEKKTWKWSNNIELTSSYISANFNVKEIEENINNVFKQRIKNNIKIQQEFDKEFDNFATGLEFKKIRTKVILEDGDDYSIKSSIDISKGANVEFNSDLPNSIINKGLGQQKEFLINYLINENANNKANTDVLLIDEIENSLSVKSLRQIIANFKAKGNNLQIIVTSHNPESIGNSQYSEINVVLVGFPPVKMFAQKIIYCEGQSDRKIFSKIFPTILFINVAGGNILDASKAYKTSIDIFYAIVDGDEAGRSYETKIMADNPDAHVHILNKGTIEDYYNSQIKEEAVLKNFNPTPETPNIDINQANFLYQIKTKDERSKIKKYLWENFDKFEAETLKQELKDFLKPFS